MGVIKRQGIKNVFITYLGVIVGAISTLYVQPELLSIDEFGFTRNLYNFSFLLSLAIPLGLPGIIAKFYPGFKANASLKDYVLGFILTYFFVAGIITVSVFLLLKNYILDLYAPESHLFISYFLCVVPLSLIIALNSCMTSFSQAAYKSTVPSFLNDVFSRLVVVLITVLYSFEFISFNQYVIVYILIYFMVTVILVIYLSRFGLISFKIKFSFFKEVDLKKMMNFGFYICVISFASFGLRSIDSIFLGFYSLGNVAIYTTAAFLAMFIEVPLGSLERISQARVTESFSKNNPAEVGKIYSESVKYLLVIGGFLFLGIIACAKYLFGFLPVAYSGSIPVVLILSFSSLVNVSTGINSTILLFSDKYKTACFMLVSVFILMIILDVLFIPTYGLIGAAVITCAISVLFNVSKLLFIYYEFGFQPYNLNSLKITGLIAAGFFIAFFLPAFTTNAFANMVISGTVISSFYIGCVYKLKVIPEIFDAIKAKFVKS